MYILAFLLFLAGIAAFFAFQSNLFKPKDAYASFEPQAHFKPKIAASDFFQLEGYDMMRAMASPLEERMNDSLQPSEVLKRFSPEQKALYFWWMLDETINTGGFADYFNGEQAKYLPALKNGLQLIGDQTLSDLLAEAEKIFEQKDKSKKTEKDPLGLLAQKPSAMFREADASYLNSNKSTIAIFENYIRTTPANFCSDEKGADIDPGFSGILKTFYPSDSLKEELPIVNGRIEGQRKTWFEDGRPCTEQTWKGGKQAGDQKAWYASGQLRYAESYSENNLLAEYWYASGEKEKEERFNAEKQLHGVQKWWYENGQLAKEINYTAGIPDGDFLQFYPDGKKKLEAEFNNGIPFYRNFWNEKGKLMLKEGTGVYIFEPETMGSPLRRETVYKDFKKEGPEKEFMDGQLVSSIGYSKDVKNGKAVYYYDNGSVRQESIYENDQLISTKDFPPEQKANQ